MKKRVIIVLLVGLICLPGVTALAYNQSPMLDARVASGELPPVEKRLPEEPLVLEPVEEIGQYGGTLNVGDTDPFNAVEGRTIARRGLFQISNDLTEVVPGAAKGYDFSEDKKTLIIYLRKGLKWSDGYPLTVDDILFYLEDYMLDKRINPVVGKMWKPGGKVAEFEKIDDYTLRIHFAVPNPNFMSNIGHNIYSRHLLILPRHYLEKFHIKYNPKANELAKEKGFESWEKALSAFRGLPWNSDLDLPVFDAYVPKKITPEYKMWERNPYFWAVDTAGNQLPYIDRMVQRLYNREVLVMKVLSGEIDLSAYNLVLGDHSVLKKNEEKGNYRTIMWESPVGSVVTFAPNQNHPDPVMRTINQDIRYRKALSLAINREEINETIFFGLATPRQATVHPTCSYFKEEWARAYAEYNPEEANRLLDEMGLEWGKTHEYRLRPDGRPLAITVEYIEMEGPRTAICELVKEYWENIGIKVSLKVLDRSFYTERAFGALLDMGVYHMYYVAEVLAYAYSPLLTLDDLAAPAVEWDRWYITDGEQGEEPPEYVKEFYSYLDEWYSATTKEEYTRLAQKLFDWHAEHLIFIGTVGMWPWPVAVKNSLRNVPKKATFSWGGTFWSSTYPETFFFKR